MGASGADTISFLVKLEEQIAGPSTKAEKALQSLNAKIASSEQAISGLEKKLTSAKEKLDKISTAKGIDSSAYRKQVSIVDELGGKLGKAKSDHDQLTGALGKYQKAADQSKQSSGSFSDKLLVVGAKLRVVKEIATTVYSVLSVIAGPALRAFFAFRSLAFGAADSHRSFLLSMQGAAGSASAAKELAAQVDKAASKYPLAEANIKAMSRALALARVSGKTAGDALEAVGLVAVTAGEESANRLRELLNKSAAAGHLVNPLEALAGSGVAAEELYTELARQVGIGTSQVEAKLKAGKISVEDGVAALNRALHARLGGVGEGVSLGLESQFAKASRDLKGLFKDINIEPMLKGLRSIFDLLDQSTASGRALKALLGGAAQGLADSTAKNAPTIKAFFQDIIIMALKTGIAMKPRLREWFGVGDVIGGEMGKGAAGAGKLKATLDAILTILGGIAKVVQAVTDPIEAFKYQGIQGEQFVPVEPLISGAKGEEAGKAMVAGVIAGVKSQEGRAAGAITNLALVMQNAFKDAQQIHSPSRVFWRFMGHITDALVGRAESDQPRVQQSISALVETPRKPSADGASSSGGSVYDVTVNQYFTGDSSEDTRREARDGLFDALDDMADAMGAPT